MDYNNGLHIHGGAFANLHHNYFHKTTLLLGHDPIVSGCNREMDKQTALLLSDYTTANIKYL